MKVLLSLALLVLSATVSIAQNPPAVTCPSISVTGPRGNLNVGELGTFRATGVDYPVEYVWSVHGGRLREGQGTSSISVIRRSDTLIAAVNIKGLLEGCPSYAAQAINYEPPILPVKIYKVQPNELFNGAAATRVAAVMLENPNNQLYILAGDVGRKNSPAFQQKQRTIIDLLLKHGITRDRITMAPVYSDVELFQFWRVPPGASNPICEECNELEHARSECPSISVTGPAGISLPEDVMYFSVTLTGDIPKELTYSWEVTNGVIMGGQGTPELRARYTYASGFRATVTVGGLPSGCPTKASEKLYMTDPTPPSEHLGTINNATYTIDQAVLRRIGESLMSNESSQLYVWVYVGSLSTSRISSLKSRLLTQLSVTKIDPSRITLNVSSEKARGATFWRVPPGTDNPAP